MVTLRGLGFSLEGTGGGNEAMVLRRGEGRGVLVVTDGNLGVDFDSVVEVGLYADDAGWARGDAIRFEVFDSESDACAALDGEGRRLIAEEREYAREERYREACEQRRAADDSDEQ